MRLPNATAETNYSYTFAFAKLGTTEQQGIEILELLSIEGLAAAGLCFSAPDSRVEGVPRPEPGTSHEYAFNGQIRVRRQSGERTEACKLMLFVNPHPRSLWKQVEPPEELPFRKPHRRHTHLGNGELVAVAASVRGRSHAQNGAFREDDFHVQADPSGKWLVVGVSDGAGSASMSRRGSQVATETSVERLAASLPGIEDELLTFLPEDGASANSPSTHCMDCLRRLLLEPVGKAAHEASKVIEATAKELNLAERDLSATLLLAAIRRWSAGYLVASYWIGDGAAAVLNTAKPALHLLGEADSGEYSGQTRFLLSSEFGLNAWEAISKRFRCLWVPAPAVLVLMTDGVSDPKFETANALKDPLRWISWWQNDLQPEGDIAAEPERLAEHLEGYLDFWSQGEHDDRTIAMVFDGTGGGLHP